MNEAFFMNASGFLTLYCWIFATIKCFIVLEYISDGMENGDSTKITINKLAEEYVYNYLKWAVLNNKYGVMSFYIKLTLC